jgi:hypothetical protein
MRLSRLILFAAIVAAAFWAVRHRDEILNRILPASARSNAPAAAPADDALTAASREADPAQSGGSVTENMTPDQVRALLGAPDEIQPLAGDGGPVRERWVYRQAGKAVVFQNGVAVSIEAP